MVKDILVGVRGSYPPLAGVRDPWGSEHAERTRVPRGLAPSSKTLCVSASLREITNAEGFSRRGAEARRLRVRSWRAVRE